MKRLIVILVILLSTLILLASCSSDGGGYSSEMQSSSLNSGSSSSSGGGSTGGGSTSGGAGGGSMSGGTTGSGSISGGFDSNLNSSEPGMSQLPILTPSEAMGKKLIYTLTLRLQTTDFMQGMRKLLDTVSGLGGYLMEANVDGRDMRTPDVERRGDYEFRIPTERLTELLIMVENNYNLWRLQQNAEDVTPRYNRSGIRLEDLLEQEQRLIDALANEMEADDRLSTERMLSDVQNQISEFFTYQLTVDDSVMFATVFVQLYEVIFPEEDIGEPEPAQEFGDKLSHRVSRSIEAFVEFCQGFLLFIVAIAPALVIIVVLGILALVIVRGVRKRRKKRSPPPPLSPHIPPYPPPHPLSQPSQPSPPNNDQQTKPPSEPQ